MTTEEHPRPEHLEGLDHKYLPPPQVTAMLGCVPVIPASRQVTGLKAADTNLALGS